MPKKNFRPKSVDYDDIRQLRVHSKARTPAVDVAKAMKRAEAAVRQKAADPPELVSVIAVEACHHDWLSKSSGSVSASIYPLGFSADHVYDGRRLSGLNGGAEARDAAQPVAKAGIACSRTLAAAASSANPQASRISNGSTLPATSISPGVHQPAFSRSASRTTCCSARRRSPTSAATAARMTGRSCSTSRFGAEG